MSSDMAPNMQLLSDIINAFGRYMEQEGVPKQTRDRVVHSVIFGTPEPTVDPYSQLRPSTRSVPSCDDPETHGCGRPRAGGH